MSTGPETRGVVYRIFDANGDLLYIGSTSDIYARVEGHRRTAVFKDRIASVHHSRRMPMTQARSQEALAIIVERPPMNRLRNPLYKAMNKDEKVRRFEEALAAAPIVNAPAVPIIDDEPQALLDELADLDLVLGESA